MAPHTFERFASDADVEACRALHEKFGTTYYFAAQRLQPAVRRHVWATYGFVRVPDEWVDNPDGMTLAERRAKLEAYRSEMEAGFRGVRPEHPVLRAFCDTVREVGMGPEEPHLFLDAMAMDLDTTRYATYDDLFGYVRGSASAVGLMMCSIFGVQQTPAIREGAIVLGEAMQLTNFLRDVREDAGRGRIYLPLEDLERFGVSEAEILDGRMSDRFAALMRFEIERARGMYVASDRAIPLLPKSAQKGVKLARILYSRILDRIEALDYDVFSARARTSKAEKVAVLAKVALGLS